MPSRTPSSAVNSRAFNGDITYARYRHPRAELAEHTGADLEPRSRDDDRIDERPFDAVVGGRLVPLVDDADRHEQHAGAHVEAARQQEVEICLLQLELAGLLEPFDERVLELELADESNAVAEAMRDQQHEAMEVEAPVFEFGLVEMEIHVARDGCRPLGGRRRRRRLRRLRIGVRGCPHPEPQSDECERRYCF